MNKITICGMFAVLGLMTSTAMAGDVRGTYYDKDVLVSGDSVTYSLRLAGDVVTEIGVKGDGDGDIDCWLSDENGNVVKQDTDATDTCYINMTPRWTGPFTLKLTNRGATSIYELLVR